MTHKIKTLTFSGIDIINVDVQIHISSGLPSFNIVGLADKTIAESKERVRAAMNSIGIALPSKRIIINLSPADLFKEGSHFDLPIALAILVEMQIIEEHQLSNYLIIGELSLDASIVQVSGVLPASIGANAQDMGLICPYSNGSEAAWSGNPDIIAAGNLLDLINHFKQIQFLPKPEIRLIDEKENELEMIDVKGQYVAKRAIEIAASGGHNLIMCGPPGAGKSMLAQRLSGILPKMSPDEMLEYSMIKSISNGLDEGKLETKRPFRAPHHSCSMPAMVGGGMGKKIAPGEISLAHNGVLFLDEFPEFPRTVLDSLRQPIEKGCILISRSSSHVTYPARFQLIAAMNPCRCGYLSDRELGCGRAPKCAIDYQMKISGPLLDRIDIHVDVQAINISEIDDITVGEDTQTIKNRVEKARMIQRERYKSTNIKTNSELDGKLLTELTLTDRNVKSVINNAAEKMKLTMRAYNRILKVARTIADMSNSENVHQEHVKEAIIYRPTYLKK